MEAPLDHARGRDFIAVTHKLNQQIARMGVGPKLLANGNLVGVGQHPVVTLFEQTIGMPRIAKNFTPRAIDQE